MILGIDTSNYTTSICVIDATEVHFEKRVLIKVSPGSKGIRQSDAFFQHMQVLHEWVKEDLAPLIPHLKAVGVSTKPRPVVDSYMPVFRAGETIGRTISTALGIPYIETTHQEGHLAAALQSCPSGAVLKNQPFIFCHLSGGTTEIHTAKAEETGYSLCEVAQTADISFGQLIDRIGVYAGLDFPCGAQMDALAKKSQLHTQHPRFKMGDTFNLSGYENFYKSLMASHPDDQPGVFYAVFEGIATILYQIITYSVSRAKTQHVLLAGGVAASQTLREILVKKCVGNHVTLHFSHPQYASDNAYGVALIASEHIKE
jgi:N6-L-threonylcarbamoyladenine synthase